MDFKYWGEFPIFLDSSLYKKSQVNIENITSLRFLVCVLYKSK